MRRTRMAVVASAAVAALALAVPAGAATAVPPPSGEITCAMTGSGKFSPAYPTVTSAPDGAPHNIRFNMTAVLSGCDASGVTGGKVPITGGKVRFSALIPEGTTCEDLAFDPPDFTSNNNKLQITWTGTTASGGKTRVGTNKGLISDAIKERAAWDLSSDPFEFRNTGAFQDEFATLHLQLDNAGDIGACVFGATDLKTVTFSAVTGSTISVTP